MNLDSLNFFHKLFYLAGKNFVRLGRPLIHSKIPHSVIVKLTKNFRGTSIDSIVVNFQIK